MSKQEVINKIRKVLQLHRYVVKAELFGLLARGEDRPGSDVDLLVVYDERHPERGSRCMGDFFSSGVG